MSNDPKLIPRNGKAGVAFAGVELKDAYLLIGGVIIGILSGIKFGPKAYLGIPAASYVINKSWLAWKKSKLPGFFLGWLYAKGYWGYSSALNKKEKIFVGDNVPINPGSADMVKKILSSGVNSGSTDKK